MFSSGERGEWSSRRQREGQHPQVDEKEQTFSKHILAGPPGNNGSQRGGGPC